VPCWKELRSGWKFKSIDGAPDGIVGTPLKEGTAPLKAKVAVKARGDLSIVAPPLVGTPAAVVAQLRASDGRCWGGTFSTPKRNAGGVFIGKSD
jgi:hypothetical protein